MDEKRRLILIIGLLLTSVIGSLIFIIYQDSNKETMAEVKVLQIIEEKEKQEVIDNLRAISTQEPLEIDQNEAIGAEAILNDVYFEGAEKLYGLYPHFEEVERIKTFIKDYFQGQGIMEDVYLIKNIIMSENEVSFSLKVNDKEYIVLTKEKNNYVPIIYTPNEYKEIRNRQIEIISSKTLESGDETVVFTREEAIKESEETGY